MTFHTIIHRTLGGAVAALAMSTMACAADYSFNLQSFLPAQATIPSKIIDVWADNVEQASGGRIEINRYAAMQLGGKPPELIDQVLDGVIDMTWNVVGYTPGRYPSTEVFELPFLVNDAGPASAAFWKMLEADIAEREFGTTHVGMPVPAVPEALSKGVIDGTTIPWEVTKALKVPELVEHHTEFTGPMLYTVTFVLVMNKDKFAALPADLQAVIEDNSGLEFSIFAGTTQQAYDTPGRDVAVNRGNSIVTLDAAQSAVWAEAAQPVYGAWIEEMKGRGLDGQAMIDQATALMNAN